MAVVVATPAQAASSKFCTGGSYTVLGQTGTKDRFRGTVAAPAGRFTVQGKYTRFTIDPATFAIYDYAFTGAANPGDLTGGRATGVYASKVPDHRGLALSDSAQVATRIPQASCGPDFTNALGLSETKDHCGATSIWDVASGGRMGMVTGEDATEVANPPTTCTEDCQAGNQVNGRLAVLGFPATVPAGSRLTPRTSADGLTAPLTAPPTAP